MANVKLDDILDLMDEHQDSYEEGKENQRWEPPNGQYRIKIVKIRPDKNIDEKTQEEFAVVNVFAEILGEGPSRGGVFKALWLDSRQKFSFTGLAKLATVLKGGETATTANEALRVIDAAREEGTEFFVEVSRNKKNYLVVDPQEVAVDG